VAPPACGVPGTNGGTNATGSTGSYGLALGASLALGHPTPVVIPREPQPRPSTGHTPGNRGGHERRRACGARSTPGHRDGASSTPASPDRRSEGTTVWPGCRPRPERLGTKCSIAGGPAGSGWAPKGRFPGRNR